MTEEEQIARFVAEHGVTRCPDGFADPHAPQPGGHRGPNRRWGGNKYLRANLPERRPARPLDSQKSGG